MPRSRAAASFTSDTGTFIVAGAMEPTADIGGDTFDCTLDRHALHLSLTDTMGHDVQAALLATMVVGALRNARRADSSLLDQAQDADQAVADDADRAPQAFDDQSEQVRLLPSPPPWRLGRAGPHTLSTAHSTQPAVVFVALWRGRHGVTFSLSIRTIRMHCVRLLLLVAGCE
ncbi:SpoIIE family protein phosphatase [Streptomyces tubercidicus]